MAVHQPAISYSHDLLHLLGSTKERFEVGARLLLPINLFELGSVTTGVVARPAGLDPVTCISEIQRVWLSPMGVEPEELVENASNAWEAETPSAGPGPPDAVALLIPQDPALPQPPSVTESSLTLQGPSARGPAQGTCERDNPWAHGQEGAAQSLGQTTRAAALRGTT